MGIFKIVISVFDILFAMMMFFFQRGQTNKATVFGFWGMIILYIANLWLIWN